MPVLTFNTSNLNTTVIIDGEPRNLKDMIYAACAIILWEGEPSMHRTIVLDAPIGDNLVWC